jgi:carbamoyltransferase
MIILGIFPGHDGGASLFRDYTRLASVALERPTRVKGDGGRFPSEAVEECLAQAGLKPDDVDVVTLPRADFPTRYFKPRARWPMSVGRSDDTTSLIKAMARNIIRHPLDAFDAAAYLADCGLKPREIAFYNHHFAHALAPLFHTCWDDALLYTSDGGGERVHYSARRVAGGRIEEIFGGERESISFLRRQDGRDSLGRMYFQVTEALGFRGLRDEGKVLGLAAFGDPVHSEALKANYKILPSGEIRGRLTNRQLTQQIRAFAAVARREDMAASAQKALEDVTIESLRRIRARHPGRNLGVSGGVFANVKLTQRIAETFAFDEVFVYPAMSDQGEATGGVLQYLLDRDGLVRWLDARAPLGNLYFGRDYMGEVERVFRDGAACALDAPEGIAERVAGLIMEGRIVGTYLGRGEYGPRALGARTIMASPVDRTINDWLNKRLNRTEFMPFAPVVRVERCADVFALPKSLYYSARYMTVTCDVKPEWRDRIPGVTHIDGTARPQLLRRADNPLYYDILAAYERRTGIPVVINTSFNAHEEPIINRPEEALQALSHGRVDFVVTPGAIFSMT